ncbi:Septum formation protein Maf [Prochlorococcus marinus str. SS2]|uniref:nucleoside triphosphate pyrophosphatase n=1 Tax=Prochlorococcus sp. SS52 TaxID=1499501 RepID=UPI0005338471|nr:MULTISPECIES: nucleoside triphosphate pyrophosphatase [Prochlorococcus]KGG20719.1 Septum formation protein Maf [Prochlorococcus marinus str. SS2]
MILASASQARRNLLEQLSIKYAVMVSHIDEGKYNSQNVKELVQALSFAKTESVVSEYIFNCRKENKALAILGCDSLFEFDGEILGKPRNKSEAICRLEKFSSKSGILHTGHCLMYRQNLNNKVIGKSFDGIICDVVSTRINFSELSNVEITKYVETGEPINCAGGFAIDGKGAVFIKSIEGCYSNVIGLSLPWLRYALNKAGMSLWK